MRSVEDDKTISDVHAFRALVVSSVDSLLDKGFVWPNEQSIEDWKEIYAEDCIYIDEIFIRICSEVLNRKIVLIPVHHKVGHRQTGKIEISPKNPESRPFYMLYYTECQFVSPHYQSIRLAFSKLRCNHCDEELSTVESLREHIIGVHGTPYQSICEVSIKEVCSMSDIDLEGLCVCLFKGLG